MDNGPATDLKRGDIKIEGKTKKVFQLLQDPYSVLIESKDRITAGDGARSHDLKGKAAISNLTNALVFNFLNKIGIKTHFIRKHEEHSFIARSCAMIPIEWVSRRLATGSFLRRFPNVKEGFRFNPPKQEIFFKDDANHDPQWSYEQLISAELTIGEIVIGRDEIEYMKRATICIFEVLEKAWASMGCVLVDMKIEFGVDLETKEILLADVIDSDSWRLWPQGDKRLMKDKQVYRDMVEVTEEALSQVKSNFGWIADKLQKLRLESVVRVIVLMGSPADIAHSEKIQKQCLSYGLACELRITSAHKGTSETLKILAEYEGMGVPVIFIAVAGRSNGLGPVLAGNTCYPVINCPPITPDWGSQDIWSSLRLPSGLGCSTVLSAEGAAQCAAHTAAVNDHVIWSKLRAQQLNTWFQLNQADKKINNLCHLLQNFQNSLGSPFNIEEKTYNDVYKFINQ